jgi:hypothetical protein
MAGYTGKNTTGRLALAEEEVSIRPVCSAPTTMEGVLSGNAQVCLDR